MSGFARALTPSVEEPPRGKDKAGDQANDTRSDNQENPKFH